MNYEKKCKVKVCIMNKALHNTSHYIGSMKIENLEITWQKNSLIN